MLIVYIFENAPQRLETRSIKISSRWQIKGCSLFRIV